MLLLRPRNFCPVMRDFFNRFSGSPAMLPDTSATKTAAMGLLPSFFSFHSFWAAASTSPAGGVISAL
ncbi:hypothetical protein D3C75_986860 [compost metagenome]